MRQAAFITSLVLLAAALSCNSDANRNGIASRQLHYVTPGDAGFDERSIENLDSLFNEYIAKEAIASAEVMVVRNGGIAYHRSFSPEGAVSGQDSIYRIMSMTKAITSVAAMMLYEQGKFLLDDPLEKYLPEFADMLVLQSVNPSDTSFTALPARRKITVRDLLRHTSGMAYSFTSPDMQMIYQKAGVVEAIPSGTEVRTMAENMKILGSLPLLHEPGKYYTYGVSTDVLGYLVEVVSGQRFDEYLTEHIFEPLGMDDSYFFVPGNKSARLAKGFSNTTEEPLVKMEGPGEIIEYHTRTDEKFFSGGAGLCTTAADYAKFLQMLLNRGTYNGARVLGPKTVDLMVTNQMAGIGPHGGSGPDDRTLEFGLGFQLGTEDSYRTKPGSLQRYSWGGALGTTYWWDTENQLAVVGMIQMLPFFHNDMWEKMEVTIYGALN